jgi:hypothetical protein
MLLSIVFDKTLLCPSPPQPLSSRAFVVPSTVNGRCEVGPICSRVYPCPYRSARHWDSARQPPLPQVWSTYQGAVFRIKGLGLLRRFRRRIDRIRRCVYTAARPTERRSPCRENRMSFSRSRRLHPLELTVCSQRTRSTAIIATRSCTDSLSASELYSDSA